MINICLVGFNGRMGQTILEQAKIDDVAIVCGIETPDRLQQSQNFIQASSFEELDIPYDTIVDFSTSSMAEKSLDYAAQHGKRWLCGVTGLPQSVFYRMNTYAKRIPIFYSANMSLGIAVLHRLVQIAAKALPQFDIEICEMHHRHKKDAPSGTALMLGQAAAQVRGCDSEHDFCFTRQGLIGERPHNQIGFSSLRGGSVAGTHTVYFLGDNEEISLTHQSHSRQIFARGALTAAKWLVNQPAGLYSMNDILEM